MTSFQPVKKVNGKGLHLCHGHAASMQCAMQVVPELVERNFGELELQQDSNYQKVWDADSASLSSAPAGGVESVTQVNRWYCEPEHLMFSLGTGIQAFF